jgi:hypothetical protein
MGRKFRAQSHQEGVLMNPDNRSPLGLGVRWAIVFVSSGTMMSILNFGGGVAEAVVVGSIFGSIIATGVVLMLAAKEK